MNALRALRVPSAMRLALSLAALFVLAALVAGTIAWALMKGELEDRLYQDARAQAKSLAQELADSGRDGLIREIGVEILVRRPARHAVCIPAGRWRRAGRKHGAVPPLRGAAAACGGA